MDAAALRAWCLEQPGAIEDFPFGPEHVRLQGRGQDLRPQRARPHAARRSASSASPNSRSPCAHSYPAIRPGYHLDKRHWNTIALDGTLPDALVRDLIEDSYDLVVSAQPKRVREQLGWAPDEG